MADAPLKLNLTISSDPVLVAKTKSDPTMTTVSDAVRIGEGADLEPYEGSYQVTPTLEGFDVPTKDRAMEDDMSIDPIPIAQVSNPQGGYTVTIG